MAGLEGIVHGAIEKVATGYGTADGPVFSRLGFLRFSDTAADKIIHWENGAATVFRERSNGAAGLTIDHQGRLLTCERDRVTRTEKDGRITVLAAKRHRPLDLIYAIDGSIYFSEEGGVAQITRGGKVRVVTTDARAPHGVAVSPNQQKLYVADPGASKIRVYTLAPDGALRDGRDFAAAAARGLKTDEAGRVWAALGSTVTAFDAEGRKLGEVAIPEPATNLNWGGGFRDLYVAARTSIYRIGVKTNGTRTY
jgi:gluconolactonase